MRYCRALIIVLLAAIVAISGCMDLSTMSDTSPATPTPLITPTPFTIPGSIGLMPSTIVDMTLKQPITCDRTGDMKQAENLTFTLKNNGAANATHVYYSIKVKDGQTSEPLYSNMVAIGNITPGGTNVSIQSVPAHKFMYFIVVQVTVYWGDNMEYGNELRPWYISL